MFLLACALFSLNKPYDDNRFYKPLISLSDLSHKHDRLSFCFILDPVLALGGTMPTPSYHLHLEYHILNLLILASLCILAMICVNL